MKSLDGWVGVSIGTYGRAIVIWCNHKSLFPQGAHCAHCTIAWRTDGFSQTDVDEVVRLRNTWMVDHARPVIGGWATCKSAGVHTSRSTRLVFWLDKDCELYDFVTYVRAKVKPNWYSDMKGWWAPHITVNQPVAT